MPSADELALIAPQGAPGDPLPAAALAGRLVAPNLFDYLMQSPATPVGEMPSTPGRLPAEWQRGSPLDAIPALTDVAGLVGPGAGKAIFVAPGSRLLRSAVRDLPRDTHLREATINSIQRIRDAAGLEPATFPRDWRGVEAPSWDQARLELRDTDARLVPGARKGEYLWQHPAGDLHTTYNVPPIKFDRQIRSGDAQVDLADKQILIGGDPRDPRVMANANYVAAHEFQHIIQNAEGLPSGAHLFNVPQHPEYWKRLGHDVAETNPAVLDDESIRIQRDFQRNQDFGMMTPRLSAAWDTYRKMAGEVEARNVETRMRNPALYERPPHETEDVPRGEQIIKYWTPPGESVPRRIQPVNYDPFVSRIELRPTGDDSAGAPRALTPQRAAGEENFHDFTMHNEQGGHVGELTINASDPRNLYVEWIGGHLPGRYGSTPNTLGPKEVRSILDEIRNKFPDAETISGFRASGARFHGKPYDTRSAAAGAEPVIRLRGGKPPPEFEGLSAGPKAK